VVSDALALPSAVIEAVGSVAATLDFRIAAAAQEGEASTSAPIDDVTDRRQSSGGGSNI
jgi:hypothetical protein